VLELDGVEIRKQPLLERETRLAKLIAKARDGIGFEGDGAAIFQAACKLGHEGVVAKRKDCPTNPAGQSAAQEPTRRGPRARSNRSAELSHRKLLEDSPGKS
jgi:hypothetical protein